jgi:hypothetical protein
LEHDVPFWQRCGFFFTIPSGVSDIVLKISNNSPGGYGNDLALDDLTFKPHNPDSTERKVIIKHDIVVSSSQIILKVWDHNVVDGDIISLNLNGTWILKEYTLTKSKKEIVINLPQQLNILVFHAENLGRIPPNTTAILVKDGKKEQKTTLNSNKGSSEAIGISIK